MAPISRFAVFVFFTGLFFFAGESTGKELRPSEHGLEFQNSPSAWLNDSSEMRSFFNSSQVSNSSDIMTIPTPSNSSDSSSSPATAWWRTGDGDGGRGHVRKVLVIASLVCGVTGVALLVATCLLFVLKHRKRNNGKGNEENGGKDNDKLQLAVVRSENP